MTEVVDQARVARSRRSPGARSSSGRCRPPRRRARWRGRAAPSSPVRKSDSPSLIHSGSSRRISDCGMMSNSKMCDEFVRDRAVEQVGRLVERQQHPVARRLGERRHAFLGRARDDVLLLELGVRLEDDQRHLEREVVLQVRADRSGRRSRRSSRRARGASRSPCSSRSRSDRSGRCASRSCRSAPGSSRSTGRTASGRRGADRAQDGGEKEAGDHGRRKRARRARAHSDHLFIGRRMPGSSTDLICEILLSHSTGLQPMVQSGRQLSKTDTIGSCRKQPVARAAAPDGEMSSRQSAARRRQVTARLCRARARL